MPETLASSFELERVLALRTVRDPAARGLLLAAVRELGRDAGSFTVERLAELMRVEEHFQALLLYDQVEFLRRTGPAAEADRDFALGVQRICVEAANGFQRFLRNRASWATGRESLELMFRVTGLALNAIHCFVKWGHFLNEPGRSTPWKQVHALYAMAEADGYAQAPFVLHASQSAFRPTVQSLYLRTLILELLDTGSLSKVQVEIADGWFSSWCADYALDTEYSSRRHLFFVDLASDSGLHLMRRDSHGGTLRYMRAEGLKAQIEEVQSGLRHGRLYAGHGGGALFPIEEHTALLAIIEKLYHSILAGSENRIEERLPFEDREVDVVLGVERILRKARERPGDEARGEAPGAAAAMEMLEVSPAGLTLPGPDARIADAGRQTPAADPDVERWRVYDLSSKGFGLLVDRAVGETVGLNVLIALRNHETGGWIVGNVVRKLANRVRGEVLVGVEVLSYRPIAVELTPPGGGEAASALYLPGLDGNGKLDALLVRVADFRAESAYAIRSGGAVYTVRLNRIIKKGADWIKARFEVDAKKS